MKILELLENVNPTTYLSFKLDKSSRKRLKNLGLTKYKDSIGNHVTLIFGISPDNAQKYIDFFENAEYTVTGYSDSGEGIDFYTVTVNGKNLSKDGRFYHITASKAGKEVPSKKSNEILVADNGVPRQKFTKPIAITGSVEVVQSRPMSESINLRDLGMGKPLVFVDMDGVLADFTKNFGKYDHDIKKLANSDPKEIYDYYNSLDMLEDGKSIIKWLNNHDIPFTILSAPIRGKGQQASIQAKKDWLAQHLGWEIARKALFTPSKFQYATNGNHSNILIDDMPKYVDPWIEHGGIGILHKNFKQTIDSLKQQLK